MDSSFTLEVHLTPSTGVRTHSMSQYVISSSHCSTVGMLQAALAIVGGVKHCLAVGVVVFGNVLPRLASFCPLVVEPGIPGLGRSFTPCVIVAEVVVVGSSKVLLRPEGSARQAEIYEPER